MAQKVGVIEPRAQTPSTYIKKSAAQLLVRRLLAHWVIENVTLKLLDVSAIPRESYSIRLPLVAKSYIPEKMPPREVPGVFFREPQTDSWRIAHRTVTFMPKETYASV